MGKAERRINGLPLPFVSALRYTVFGGQYREDHGL